MEITIITLDVEDIHRIAPLWEKLNAQHLAASAHFKEHFAGQTFEARCSKFRAMPESAVHIGAARNENGRFVGYCICSALDETGELDSIYIEPEYRGQGLGGRLASNGVDWLKSKGCRHIDVMVAEGNESVFPFYEKLGFCIRGTVLRLK